MLSCDTDTTCLVINPHLFELPRNTAYGTNSVLATVVPGDLFSFYNWPQRDMISRRHPGAPLAVVSTEEITDAKLLAEAATLVPELKGDSDCGRLGADLGGWTSFTNKTVSWNAKELWRVHFNGSAPNGVGRGTIINIDTIANAGAKIIKSAHSHLPLLVFPRLFIDRLTVTAARSSSTQRAISGGSRARMR